MIKKDQVEDYISDAAALELEKKSGLDINNTFSGQNTFNKLAIFSEAIYKKHGTMWSLPGHLSIGATNEDNVIFGNRMSFHFILSNLTTTRQFTLPDKSGIMALLDDITGKSLTGAVLSLSNILGNNYNYAAASAATTYTKTTPVINGYATCLINAATEPVVTGATKIAGATFTANTDMEMVVESKDGVNARYFFLKL